MKLCYIHFNFFPYTTKKKLVRDQMMVKYRSNKNSACHCIYYSICFVVITLNISLWEVYAVPITNSVIVNANKAHYSSFSHITCSISGIKNNRKLVNKLINNGFTSTQREYPTDSYKASREYIRIVKSSQLYGTNVSNLIDQSDFPSMYLDKTPNNTDAVNATVQMEYTNIIGAKFDPLSWNEDNWWYYDTGLTKIKEQRKNFTAGPFHCIVFDYDNQKVLGASKPFTIGPPNPVSIALSNQTYFDGQILNATITPQNNTLVREFGYFDYLRLYKVPYDIRKNTSVLNTKGGNAIFIEAYQYRESSYSLTYSTSLAYSTAGMYQLVLFSEYNQLIRGVSNVFRVYSFKRNKNTTVTFNNGTITAFNGSQITSIYPGQSVQITVNIPTTTQPSPPLEQRLIRTAFIPAKDSVYAYFHPLIVEYTSEFVYKGNNLTLTTGQFNRIKPGYYKVVVFASNTVIAVSKGILIKQPNIQILLPKLLYYQWESPFNNEILNPYFDLDQYGYQYSFEIYPLNFTFEINPASCAPTLYGLPIYNYYDKHQKIVNGNVLTLPHGMYNIRLFTHSHKSVKYGLGEQRYTLESEISIRNTTFTIAENKGIFTIQGNTTRYRYRDIINFTFTTEKKVALYGNYEIYATGKTYDYHIGTVNMPRSKKTSITDSIYIDPYVFGCSSLSNKKIPLQVSLYLTNVASSYYGQTPTSIKAYSNTYILLDQTSRPVSCEKFW